jgi:carnitine-CoA ligase
MTAAGPDAPPVPGEGLLRGPGDTLGAYALRYPVHERTLVRVLRDQAAARGDQPWLVFDGADVVTFREASALANRVGHAVRATVGAGAHVALFLRNQREFMPCFYGPMTVEGVTVPLNPDARGVLLQYVVEKSEAAIIIARTDGLGVLDRLDGLGGVRLVVAVGEGPLPERVCGVPVTGFETWLEGHPADDPGPPPEHHRMALLQFTSGTTGRQKGAIYSHHWLHTFSALMSDSQERTPEDVLMTPMPLCHVAALHLVANSALHVGCTAHLPSRFSATDFWHQVADSGATWAMILGPMAAIILKLVDEAPPHSLRHVFCVPPPPEREEFERRYGVEMLWQGYGSTEIFPMPMRLHMEPDMPADTIGRCVSWMDFGVVDEHDNLLPPGDVGELVFRPRIPFGMIDGYYKDPEATVSALRNFAFHTGDLGTYDERGFLHYRGRRQERIRVRGENVSALEVEFVALRHPEVVEAAAYGVPSNLGEEDVKLDVVLKGDVALPELHAWLEENLPRFMVPRYLERRDAFPKTASERIQKYLLTRQALDRPEVHDAGPRRRRSADA